MNNSKHLHIAIAADDNYARFAATLIYSVITSNTTYFDGITFHLLSNNINPSNVAKIESLIHYNHIDLKIYDISDLSKRLGIEVPQTIALTSYARLFLTQIISPDISRILYLDTDIVVLSNLSSLWEYDLSQYYVGGCLDIFDGTKAKTDIGLDKTDPYINAGMLLINLDNWRKADLPSKFLRFLLKHNGKVHHHDQGIINGVCKQKVLLLPPEYNIHSSVISHPYRLISKITIPYYSREEYEYALNNPVIIHFTEGFYNRPWKKNCRHPYKQTFLNIQENTPWADVPMMPDKRTSVVKLLSFVFLNFPYPVYKITSRIISAIRHIKS